MITQMNELIKAFRNVGELLCYDVCADDDTHSLHLASDSHSCYNRTPKAPFTLLHTAQSTLPHLYIDNTIALHKHNNHRIIS